LGAVELSGAAAQFVQDLTGTLKVGLFRDADVAGVGAAKVGQGTAERVSATVGLLHLLARHLAGLLAHHHLLGHLLSHGLQSLLKLVQSLSLGRNRGAGLTLLQRLTSLSHGSFGAAQRARDLAAHLTQLAHQLAQFPP
jgi:hypothetical protein